MANKKSILKIAICGAVLGLGLVLSAVQAKAESTATVSVESAFIRSTASTSGTTVASAMKNDKLTIVETTTDSAGNTWYKVQVDATTTGYIRADLVTLSGDTPTTSTPSTSTPSTSTSTTVEQGGTPVVSEDIIQVTPVTGKTSGDVRVRKGPSTSTSVIDSVSSGTEVTVTGYEEASDGKWYYLSYNSKTGYIRSDFISLDGELVPVTEEPQVDQEPDNEPAPEPEPAPVYQDYEVVYELDGNGDTVWYLNDYTEGTKNSITELIQSKKDITTLKETYDKKLKGKNILIAVLVVLIVLLIALIVAAVILFMRNYDFGSATEEPVKASKPVTTNSYGTKRRNRDDEEEEDEGEEEEKPDKFKTETVGQTQQSAAKSYSTAGAVLSEDGQYLIYPDGSKKKVSIRVRTPEGAVTTGNSYQEKNEIPLSESKKARNFVTDEDDVELNFLRGGSRSDD